MKTRCLPGKLTKVRIQKAMELLVCTEESIERIAEMVGYGTGFALSKAFKRSAGCRRSIIECRRWADLLNIRRDGHCCLQPTS